MGAAFHFVLGDRGHVATEELDPGSLKWMEKDLLEPQLGVKSEREGTGEMPEARGPLR